MELKKQLYCEFCVLLWFLGLGFAVSTSIGCFSMYSSRESRVAQVTQTRISAKGGHL